MNLWEAGPDELTSVRTDFAIEVTWGGIAGLGPGKTVRSYAGRADSRPPDRVGDRRRHMGGLRMAGCRVSPEQLAEAADEVRLRLVDS